MNLNGVRTGGTELFSGETDELTVQDYVARRITYNYLRRVRVIRSNREIASSNCCAEVGRLSRPRIYVSCAIKWIITRQRTHYLY